MKTGVLWLSCRSDAVSIDLFVLALQVANVEIWHSIGEKIAVKKFSEK
jgi:hypothetical protein